MVIFRSWHFVPKLEVTEVEGSRFIFSFPSSHFRDRILDQSPWNIKGCLLVLKPWDSDESVEEVNPEITPLWIQVHGLPLNLSTKEEAFFAGS